MSDGDHVTVRSEGDGVRTRTCDYEGLSVVSKNCGVME